MAGPSFSRTVAFVVAAAAVSAWVARGADAAAAAPNVLVILTDDQVFDVVAAVDDAASLPTHRLRRNPPAHG